LSVHQLKDGRWIVQYRDKSKKSGYTREYLGGGLEAEKKARTRNDELDLGSYTPRTQPEQSPTFEDLADNYMVAKSGTTEKNLVTGPEPTMIKEIQALLKSSADHLRCCLLISFYTGLRPGHKELLTLQWKAVDLVAETILITSARRGGPRSRFVPIHPTLLKSLKKWRIEDKDKKAPEIITYRGQPVQRIKKAFYTAKKRAGINRRLRIYDFRHSFATTVLGQEADLKSTSEIMDHSRPDTTMKHYQHTNLKLHRKTINKLPQLKLLD